MPDARRDWPRAIALLVVAVAQIVAGALGGSGVWGTSVGTVANSYPHPLLPAGTAFSIWSLIYVAFLGLAIRQVSPGQRGRATHRRTGWWLVAAGVLNVAWVAVFSQRLISGAEVVIVVLLLCLAVAFTRCGTAGSWGDRLLLHGPVALYLGWVSLATVVGAATVAAANGVAVTAVTSVVVIAVMTVAIAAVLVRANAIAGFAGAVVWALLWIAVASEGVVRGAALAATLVLAVVAVVRVTRAANPSREMWG